MTPEEEAGLIDIGEERPCPRCGVQVPDTAFATHCPSCGRVLRCLSCGAPMLGGQVCPRLRRSGSRRKSGYCGPTPAYAALLPVAENPAGACEACGCSSTAECGGPSYLDGLDVGPCQHVDEEGEILC